MNFDVNHLDSELVKCLGLVIDNLRIKKIGLVGAAILSEERPPVYGVSLNYNGKWVHAERVAFMRYRQKYNYEPNENCIIVTTLSPCFNKQMPDRYKGCCSDIIKNSNIRTVYTALIDYTETSHNKNFYQNCGYNLILSNRMNINNIANSLLKLIIEQQRLYEK